MNFYPPKISQKFHAPKNVGRISDANGSGTGATLVCGAALRFSLQIERETKEILQAKFQTNGCGYLIAAADVLAEAIVGKKLTELHSLDKDFFQANIEAKLDKFPAHRKHCLDLCAETLKTTFADFRARQIDEFAGEKALICTCFGVSEETIERAVEKNSLFAVEEVTGICSAGGGCGACQPLIQEIIDIYWREH